MSLCAFCEEEPATTTWDHGYDYAFWTRQPQVVPCCAHCYAIKDNEEAPEPDGEAFRGGEAAAYRDEQMEAARRLK